MMMCDDKGEKSGGRVVVIRSGKEYEGCRLLDLCF